MSNERMLATLKGDALTVALELLKVFPDMVITSAGRTVLDQAKKMAHNVMRNRNWIKETYVLARAATECQAWTEIHPFATEAECTEAYARIIESLDFTERRRLSKHIVDTDQKGEAFDVLPKMGARGEQLKHALAKWAFDKSGKFLDREGGLEIWHWQSH